MTPARLGYIEVWFIIIAVLVTALALSLLLVRWAHGERGQLRPLLGLLLLAYAVLVGAAVLTLGLRQLVAEVSGFALLRVAFGLGGVVALAQALRQARGR